MKQYSGFFRYLSGIVILILAILISRFFPSWVEINYSLVIYPKLNKILQFFIGWIPMPLFFPILFYLIYRYFNSLWRKKKGFGFIIQLTAKYCLIVVVLFYIFWGFNYQRLHIINKLYLQDVLVTDSLTNNVYNQTIDSLNFWANKVRTQNLNKNILKDDIKLIVEKSVQNVLINLGYPKMEIGKLKEFWPKGLLLRIRTAGFYFPFTGEAYFDTGLHLYQLPFTLCHEYAHSQGFADEGECNFIAYLACMDSNNMIFKYSANISLYKTILSLRKNAYRFEVKSLNSFVEKDLQTIREEMQKYPDYLPKLRDKIYDIYLKLQGIDEGELNYSSFVQLLIKYKKHIKNEY